MRKHYTIVQYQGIKNFTLVAHLGKFHVFPFLLFFKIADAELSDHGNSQRQKDPNFCFLQLAVGLMAQILWPFCDFFCYSQYRSTNHIYIWLLKDGFKMVTKGHCLFVYFDKCSVQLCQKSKLFGISEFPHFITTSQLCFSYFVLD